MVGAVVGVLPLWWFIPERFARLGSAYVSCDRLTVTFKGNIAAATLWPLVTGLLTMALAPSTQKTAKNLQIGAAGPSCGRVGEFRRLKDKETDMKIRSADIQNSGAVLLAFALLLVAGCSSSATVTVPLALTVRPDCAYRVLIDMIIEFKRPLPPPAEAITPPE